MPITDKVHRLAAPAKARPSPQTCPYLPLPVCQSDLPLPGPCPRPVQKLQTFGLMLPTDLNNYTDRPQTLLCVRPDQPRPDEVMAASSVATARAEESSATSTSTQQTQPTAPTVAAAVPEDVAAAVAAQAAAVRRLKESGLGNKDPAVAAAVLELKRLKGLAEA